MNDHDYHLIRQVAATIRDEAFKASNSNIAVSDFEKAVGVLYEEIRGDDITFATPEVFAERLDSLARAIRAQSPTSS